MKIRGNVLGTTIKPERVLVKATDLTEEQKAQARENLGLTGALTNENMEEIVENVIAALPVYSGEVEDV